MYDFFHLNSLMHFIGTYSGRVYYRYESKNQTSLCFLPYQADVQEKDSTSDMICELTFSDSISSINTITTPKFIFVSEKDKNTSKILTVHQVPDGLRKLNVSFEIFEAFAWEK